MICEKKECEEVDRWSCIYTGCYICLFLFGDNILSIVTTGASNESDTRNANTYEETTWPRYNVVWNRKDNKKSMTLLRLSAEYLLSCSVTCG